MYSIHDWLKPHGKCWLHLAISHCGERRYCGGLNWIYFLYKHRVYIMHKIRYNLDFLIIKKSAKQSWLAAGQPCWWHCTEEKFCNWKDITSNEFSQQKLLLNHLISCILKQIESKDLPSHNMLLEIQYWNLFCALKVQEVEDALTEDTACAAPFSGEMYRKAKKHSDKYSLLELKCIKMHKVWKSIFR